MIDILLPVYNGEKYIREQIDSLEGQTYKDFRIIIRNDGSIDNSASIIEEVASMYDNIWVITDNSGNIGLSKTLELLINYSDAAYFMFCDQDDKWMPNKVSVSLRAMNEMEVEHPKAPILVCTDSTCVDDNENIIASSFFESQKYEDVTDDTTKIAAMNVVQGNTCIMNSLCKQYILPFPKHVLYDHWCGIIISHYGFIKYLHQPTLWYRQHQGNVLGANDVGFKYFTGKVLHFRKQCRLYYSIFKNIPFKVNPISWIGYKIYFSIKRTCKHYIIKEMKISYNNMGGGYHSPHKLRE